MDQARHARQEPQHVRDVSRSDYEVQRCKCGHVTRTLDEMRQHVAHPERDDAPAGQRMLPQRSSWER